MEQVERPVQLDHRLDPLFVDKQVGGFLAGHHRRHRRILTLNALSIEARDGQ
jgi:hypothetical protein